MVADLDLHSKGVALQGYALLHFQSSRTGDVIHYSDWPADGSKNGVFPWAGPYHIYIHLTSDEGLGGDPSQLGHRIFITIVGRNEFACIRGALNHSS